MKQQNKKGKGEMKTSYDVSHWEIQAGPCNSNLWKGETNSKATVSKAFSPFSAPAVGTTPCFLQEYLPALVVGKAAYWSGYKGFLTSRWLTSLQVGEARVDVLAKFLK